MKVFLLKVLIVKKSQKLCLFEKLTSETWGWICETPFFSLIYASLGRDFMESQLPGGKWISKG